MGHSSAERRLPQRECGQERKPLPLALTRPRSDIAVAFSCEYVLAKSIGTKGKVDAWPLLKQWLRTVEARPAYKQTLQTGAKHDFCLLESTGA